ncbi:hypothetical protein [Actinoplanes sp. NPDC049118]|uniref:hypothetical protein n=1 Tax=Actinoplanes sp. NPDC049118 TaxID=3155769 RepID=UPI00341063B0
MNVVVDTRDIEPKYLVNLVTIVNGQQVPLPGCLTAEQAAQAQSYLDKDDYRPYRDEEKAGYLAYLNFLKNHKTIEIVPANHAAFDPSKYTTQPDIVDDPVLPVVPNYEVGDAGSGIQVNTDALRTFAKNLDELKKYVVLARDKVKLVDARPGFFSDAAELKKNVSNLKRDSELLLTGMAESFVDLQTDIGTLVKEYDTVEELNALSSEDLAAIFKESFGDISGLGGKSG